MRRCASALLTVCLGASLPTAAAAEDPPAPALAPTVPAPAPTRDPSSVPLMATGGVLLNLGALSAITGFALWYANSRSTELRPEPSTLPGVGIGIGGILMVIGATFTAVGVKRHQRSSPARAHLRLQPSLGPAGLAVVGRF